MFLGRKDLIDERGQGLELKFRCVLEFIEEKMPEAIGEFQVEIGIGFLLPFGQTRI